MNISHGTPVPRLFFDSTRQKRVMQRYSKVVMYPWPFRLLRNHISRLSSTHFGYVTGVDPGWERHPQLFWKNGKRVEFSTPKDYKQKLIYVRDT